MKPRILALGSSIMQCWANASAAFPQYDFLNKAIGGSRTVDWLTKAADLACEWNPSVILMYVGSNDMFVREPEEIAENVMAIYRSAAPAPSGRLFLYLSIVDAPQKKPVREKVTKANDLIRQGQVVNPNFRFIDINPAFLGADGEPVEGYYMDDLLHYTPAGYEALSRFAGPRIVQEIGIYQKFATVA